MKMLLSGLSTQIFSAMLNDPRTQDTTGTITINTDQGIVTLSGNVPDEKARQAAEEISWETEGVIDVQNRLTVEE